MRDDVMLARDRIYLELANRHALVSIHAWIAIIVGLTMAFTGAPSPIEANFGPWSRLVVGGWALLFGLVLLLGVNLSHRRLSGWVTLIVGAFGLSMWHSMIALAYTDAVFETPIQLLKPGEPLDPGFTSREYIPFIYLGYLMLVLTHAVTLMLLDRPRR